MRDRMTCPVKRPLGLGALGLTVLLVLAACGFGGGSSDDNGSATATIQTTINLEASPTAPPTSAAIPASTPAASPQATPEATGQSPVSVSTPLNLATPAEPAATPAATGATPAAASPEATSNKPPTVTSCAPDPNEIPAFSGDNPNYRVTANGLNFRAGPGTDCDPLGDPLPIDTPVIVVSDPVNREGQTDRWVEVEVDGQDGWVAVQFIEPAS